MMTWLKELLNIYKFGGMEKKVNLPIYPPLTKLLIHF